jgi:hypothetical protein
MELIRNKPVAKFYYKGSHSHPVKRTVLITETNDEYIKGHELREGQTVRAADAAPVKTFRLDQIATTNKLRNDSPLRTKKKANSTLERSSLTSLEKIGA